MCFVYCHFQILFSRFFLSGFEFGKRTDLGWTFLLLENVWRTGEGDEQRNLLKSHFSADYSHHHSYLVCDLNGIE
jgi:hypothetical protein